MSFTIQRTIDNQTIEDVIVTALEGGSNYWYYLTENAVKGIKDATPTMEGEPLSMRFVEALVNGAVIPIHDYEDPSELLGEVSQSTLAERTEKLIADGHEERLNAMVEGQGDAGDADVIFQYWVMGEIVFG